jgi:hypothetical protein
MKKLIFLLAIFLVALGSMNYALADVVYNASGFMPGNNPSGSEITPMNLNFPGEMVRIIGSGFGDRNLNDGVNEMIYVTNPTSNGNPLWMIYRGLYDSGGLHYFGLMLWSDNEIDFEVLPGYAQSLGSFVILRTYIDSSDNNGTSVIGTLAPIPEPATLGLLGFGALAFVRRVRR